MKRREFNKRLAATGAVILSPFSRARQARAGTAGGATLVFSYPSGFANMGGDIHLCDAAGLHGSIINLITQGQGHNASGAWYSQQLPPSAFTTQFTFALLGLGGVYQQAGITFCIQNTDRGSNYAGDANMCGYSGGTGQHPPADSVAIKFDSGGMAQAGNLPSTTGLYFNGGPSVASGSLSLLPFDDLSPYGINFYSGHTFQVTIVYDGALLTMVIQDTTTNAQGRYVWPLNLANTTNANGNYVGFTAGTVSTGTLQVQSWSYWSGYNTRLATPTFSPPPGQYASGQSVTISAPPGASIYYTTNGLLPTSSSAQYTGGAINVSSNEVIQAVAIQSGYTDSLVATGAYQIGTAAVISLPSGFGANDGVVPVGYAYKSGSALVLTDNSGNGKSGAGWFCTPVNIQSGFTTTFQAQWTGGANGMCFVIQNNPQAYSSPSNAINWSGGLTAVGQDATGLGYGGYGSGTAYGLLNSVAIAFDLYTVQNSVGLYTHGATPIGSQRSMTGGGINLMSGHVFNVTLSYSGTTLTLTITDATNSNNTFTTSWNIDIPSTVGANTAYVGFTGGTGGGTAIQRIESWIFTTSSVQTQTLPVPAAPTNLRIQ